MKIKLINQEEKPIYDISDWPRPVKDSGQWVDGFSAKEFAKYVLRRNLDFKGLIANVLESCGINRDQDFTCIPEALTSLDDGFNGERHHDLLMCGQDCIIGIEAKVKETFDRKIGNVLNQQKNSSSKGVREDQDTRAYNLFRHFTGKDDISGEYANLRYQLFTAIKGTIAYTNKVGKTKCIMLVIQLIPEGEEDDSDIARNKSDLINFINTVVDTKNVNKLKDGNVECWICERSVFFLNG